MSASLVHFLLYQVINKFFIFFAGQSLEKVHQRDGRCLEGKAGVETT